MRGMTSAPSAQPDQEELHVTYNSQDQTQGVKGVWKDWTLVGDSSRIQHSVAPAKDV